MKTNLTKIFLIFAFGLMVQTVSAQTDTKDNDDSLGTRDAVANVFRPVPNPVPVPKPTQKRTYTGKTILKPKKKIKPPVPTPNPPIVERFGATMWKLRSEQKSDTGERIFKMGGGSKLVAERVPFDTVFRPKEMVRLSIEVPRKGYLYVIDREINKNCILDGVEKGKNCNLGDAYLIFPTLRTRGGDNRVDAGMIVEIPAQNDDPSYFDISPLSENYAGEMLTIIVSPTPIKGLQLQNDPLIILAKTFADWEDDWEEPTKVFNLTGAEKSQWTAAEKNAGQGTSPITQDDPLPQTLFEVKVPKGRAFMVSFPIKVSTEK